MEENVSGCFFSEHSVQETLTPGKRATAACVWRLVFAILPLFDAP